MIEAISDLVASTESEYKSDSETTGFESESISPSPTLQDLQVRVHELLVQV